ncbi:MAG TPA: hypothetical protein VFW79_05680 [Cellulomonas sp.]|uniref:hypothetical protein n=1 Tax=Cellulomonas sp. TaxID=40001 RepID=UPI002E3815A8|nr:hypothetical protein [Cellulomonas sp.]HEX5332116.1 hypothetical protein [Cellulomonas sp.]
MRDDQAAEPRVAVPDDVADDARFDLLAAPLAGPTTGPDAEPYEPEPEQTDVQEPEAEQPSVQQADAEQPAVEQPPGVQPEVEQPDVEHPDAIGKVDEDPLLGQAAEAGPTSDAAAAPEPVAQAAEPDEALDPGKTTDLGAVGATLPMWLPATAPVHAVPVAGPVIPYEPPAPSVPRHRRQPWALLVLSILLALTLGLATYLLLTTRAYERRSAEWEAAARTTGSDLTQARADLEATTSDLAATRDQLATAQARIVELADEKAQLGDDRAVQRQLVDYQQRISAAAGNVATALNSCIDGQYKLIGYLENPSAYDQADLARFRTDVQTVCGAATDANAALQRELKK